MKKVTINLVIPLTVISFATITKWWYALPVDAPDTLLVGFPFPFACEGWHTSMSLQIFLLELFADVLTFFILWFLLINGINRYWRKIKINPILTRVLWVLVGFIFSGATLLIYSSDSLFYYKRPFDMDILETGYKFVWQQIERPSFDGYMPDDRK